MIIDTSEYNGKNVKINIFLKNGEEYLGKDIPVLPEVYINNFISFIENGCITSFPISEVKKIENYI